MSITRRSFLAGIGSVSVGLLFHRQLDRILESLERDLAAEPATPDQPAAAADIAVQPAIGFRPVRLVIPLEIASQFVIENIQIGGVSQFAESAGPIPAAMFVPCAVDAAMSMDAAPVASEIRFRVRYVGNDKKGARFQAALIGHALDGRQSRMVLPIDSGGPIAA